MLSIERYDADALNRRREFLKQTTKSYLKLWAKHCGTSVSDGDVFKSMREYQKNDIPLENFAAKLEHHINNSNIGVYYFWDPYQSWYSRWIVHPCLLIIAALSEPA